VKQSIGRYQLERVIGEGGMGVVYAAHDDQLGRPVAIKTIRSDTTDLTARERLWREARVAAAVSHPNVCHVYEVGEDDGTMYIAMELLDGEPLAARIARGPLATADALPVALGVLEALKALHGRGIVHRDLKPANVFLTPHGVKLLDFGLARARNSGVTHLDLRVTAPGLVTGTPRYMAPEQLEGEEATIASDIFAFGTMLYEMATGRAPFDGPNIWAISNAIMRDDPPPIVGGAALLEPVIKRCLAKRPRERFPSVAPVEDELRRVATRVETGSTPSSRQPTRLMVLPFRLIRADAEIDFLGFSLADALVTSLTGLGPLVVRSSHVAQRFAADTPDLRRIADEGQVDAVLMGSLLRSGSRLRLTGQLVDAPGGAILWSKTMQVDMGDVFEVQDALARQVVDALAVPLSTLGQGLLGRDVPASGRAYELYLRANHLAHGTIDAPRLLAARELYAACLAEDPNYAPAWARIARVHRVLAKHAETRDDAAVRLSGDAFERAFVLNPDLPVLHHFYTYFEIEQLGRAEAAMQRLIGRAHQTPNDPELFAGLVTAFRYCGLLEASIAADARARGLDPAVRTSVGWTWALLRNEAKIRSADDPAFRFMLLMYLCQADRLDEVREVMGAPAPTTPIERLFIGALEAALTDNVVELRRFSERMRKSGFQDPEGAASFGLLFARTGAYEDALIALEEALAKGFTCTALEHQPWLSLLQGHEGFERVWAQAQAARDRAAAALRAAGGERLLGLTS
jgi:serine/threonine protein kinase